jgi:hypothetical protein
VRPEDPCATQSQPFASLAGSRLIFTNARNVTGFPQPPMVMPGIGLDYKVIRDRRGTGGGGGAPPPNARSGPAAASTVP